MRPSGEQLRMPFDHEKLDVYHPALDALELCDQIGGDLPPGRANVRDQLDRASTSVVANIAEGAGEFSRPEKARFYRIARRSAIESSPGWTSRGAARRSMAPSSKRRWSSTKPSARCGSGSSKRFAQSGKGIRLRRGTGQDAETRPPAAFSALEHRS